MGVPTMSGPPRGLDAQLRILPRPPQHPEPPSQSLNPRDIYGMFACCTPSILPRGCFTNKPNIALISLRTRLAASSDQHAPPACSICRTKSDITISPNRERDERVHSRGTRATQLKICALRAQKTRPPGPLGRFWRRLDTTTSGPAWCISAFTVGVSPIARHASQAQAT